MSIGRPGEAIRRYEHDLPGSLIHVDVKKVGSIPDGGGWRFVGRQQGDRNRYNDPGESRNTCGNELMKRAVVRTVIDDHSRLAYVEVHDNETAATGVEVVIWAVDWFANRGVTGERVLSDNGSASKSGLWAQACDQRGITVKKTRPYRL